MTHRAIVLVLALGFAACTPRAGAAQGVVDGGSVELETGARVRVTSRATGRFVGTLVGATSDSVRVELAGGSSVVIPRSAIAQLEVSAGVRRNGWRGAGIGLLAGAGVGGAIGLATYRRTECRDPLLDVLVCSLVDQTSRSVTVMTDAVVGATGGAIVGALIGQVGRERWVRLPLEHGLRIGVAPRLDGGMSIAVRASF
jgi:hypothetical protein